LLGRVLRAGVQRARAQKEAAIEHALSLLPGSGVFLEAAASPRFYRVQAHKQTCVCPHVEVHTREWKLYAPTQDVAFFFLLFGL
jgi:hypothetical protein